MMYPGVEQGNAHVCAISFTYGARTRTPVCSFRACARLRSINHGQRMTMDVLGCPRFRRDACMTLLPCIFTQRRRESGLTSMARRSHDVSLGFEQGTAHVGGYSLARTAH